MWFGNVAL